MTASKCKLAGLCLVAAIGCSAETIGLDGSPWVDGGAQHDGGPEADGGEADGGPDPDGGPEADGGPETDGGRVVIEYCEGAYYSLDEHEEVTAIAVPCARGTICGDGVDFMLCRVGEQRAISGGAPVPAYTIRRNMDRLPGYPWCRQTEPSPFGDRCVFQPGCEGPVGIWCSQNLCGGQALRPIDHCQREPSCQLVHCGCDGVTYEGLPYHPFRHPGPCR